MSLGQSGYMVTRTHVERRTGEHQEGAFTHQCRLTWHPGVSDATISASLLQGHLVRLSSLTSWSLILW